MVLFLAFFILLADSITGPNRTLDLGLAAFLTEFCSFLSGISNPGADDVLLFVVCLQRPPASRRCLSWWPAGSRTTLWTASASQRWTHSTRVLTRLRSVWHKAAMPVCSRFKQAAQLWLLSSFDLISAVWADWWCCVIRRFAENCSVGF